MQKHELKIWPEYFDALLSRKKTFEIRKNDRNFEEGDLLDLKEWNPNTKGYTGRSLNMRVTYIFRGDGNWIPTDMVVMSVVHEPGWRS